MATIRFYYAMAASAVLGLSVYETMGGKCCADLAVSEDNQSMKQLLHLTRLPTIKEMVKVNAGVIVSQVESMKPEWFYHRIGAEKRKEDKRKERVLKDNKDKYIPKHFSKEIEGTLMHELLELAWLTRVETRAGFKECHGNFEVLWEQAEVGWKEFVQLGAGEGRS